MAGNAATWELHDGDCVAGMASLPNASVDAVITDPPYEAEAHTEHRMVARAGGRLECEPIAFPPITEEVRLESARQMARVARRWILVFCQVEAAMKWRAALEAGGAIYKRTCQWIKPDGKPQYSGDRPGIGYESIVACHAPGRSTDPAPNRWTVSLRCLS
jgi:site-specific DNA-methyltransferase (adenine-specific)